MVGKLILNQPKLGILECNRCMLQKWQDEAGKKKMSITLRKSLYGMDPKKPGVDVYMHPRGVEIPSNFTFAHEGDPNAGEFWRMLASDGDRDDQDFERYFVAWYPAIPPKCVCKGV